MEGHTNSTVGTQKNKTKQSKWCENLGQTPEKTEEEEEEEEGGPCAMG